MKLSIKKALLVSLLAFNACGDDAETAASDISNEPIETSDTSQNSSETYCEAIDELSKALAAGGVPAYDQSLAAVVASAPDGDKEAWRLMQTLSLEPFSYENFNPAVDSIEAILPRLEAECEIEGPLIINADGRVSLLGP